MNKRFRYLMIIGILSLLSVASGSAVYAQGATDFRFNEILVDNTNNYVDNYGNRYPWVEIVNTSYSNVNIGGCYLTDDKNNLSKHRIPSDSPTTTVYPRGFIILFASENHPGSINHLNFTIEAGKTIYLVDANGKDIIDKLEIPTTLGENISYCRENIDSDSWIQSEQPTPLASNKKHEISSGELFIQHDPIGFGMVTIAMIVVFSILALLSVIYLLIGRFFTRKVVIKTDSSGSGEKVKEKQFLSGEINAAIAMTIHQYQSEIHDHENTILTVKKVTRSYSPWNSKIQLLRKYPPHN